VVQVGLEIDGPVVEAGVQRDDGLAVFSDSVLLAIGRNASLSIGDLER